MIHQKFRNCVLPEELCNPNLLVVHLPPQNSGLEIFHENFMAGPAKGPLHQKLYQHGNNGTAGAK